MTGNPRDNKDGVVNRPRTEFEPKAASRSREALGQFLWSSCNVDLRLLAEAGIGALIEGAVISQPIVDEFSESVNRRVATRRLESDRGTVTTGEDDARVYHLRFS
jgi:hypothetical protein